MNKECEELEKKYNQMLEMLKDSFSVFKDEVHIFQKEKDRKKSTIISYKKRITEQMKVFKQIINSQEKIIESYKNKNLELTKENILLKNKFKKVASSFTEHKENKLIYKYFKNDVEIEQFLNKIVNEVLKNEFTPKKISPLYFRKEVINTLHRYLIKELTLRTKLEKISILLSSIVMKKFYHKIYLFITSFFIEKIENEQYSNFLKILLTKTLVDKDRKFQPIKIEYSIDDIKMIHHKYEKLSFKKEDLFMKMDLEKVDNDINNCLEKIKNKEKDLEKLTQEENDILVKLTNSDDDKEKEEIKKDLENIDAQKRIIIDSVSKLKKELENLENKKTFLQPVNEIVFDNSLKDSEKEIVKKYNQMVNNFAVGLEKALSEK